MKKLTKMSVLAAVIFVVGSCAAPPRPPHGKPPVPPHERGLPAHPHPPGPR
ncbi:hypothetical protein [uncultured Chryseobacterium sp.]|uniref:hypothetical protein n=1 Tax=uncultured Chryseobacterium sp. TaxID=259322 RepID=UPI0025D764EC|nr:hypothetical protein [uncultured Chryseobacterium sp.]